MLQTNSRDIRRRMQESSTLQTDLFRRAIQQYSTLKVSLTAKRLKAARLSISHLRSAAVSLSKSLTFPENYNAENLKGKPAVFKCKIHEIKAKEYAELDDEFAKDVSDFDTLDEFKADIRAKLEESAKNAADAKLDADITDAVIEKLEGEIPDAMINNRVDDLVRDWEYRNRYQGITVADYLKFTNTTIEQFKENFKEPAAKQVKLRLALEKIAQKENVAVTDEDVEKEYAEMAENYKMELDKVKALVAEEALRKDLEVEKAFDIVRESADVTEVTE